MNDKLAGREAIFEVKVKEILEAVPMAIDDELATALGEKDLASLQATRCASRSARITIGCAVPA